MRERALNLHHEERARGVDKHRDMRPRAVPKVPKNDTIPTS